MNLLRTAALLAAMTAIFMAVGYAIGGQTGMLIALVFAGGMNFFSYWRSGDMVLRMHRAVEVDERNAPEYYEIVRGLAQSAGLPMPKVYVIDNPQPNAFATGRNPQNAAVAATTGLLNTLSPEEVAGVMAHELAHVQNRDTLTMTVTATLAGAISMLGNFAFFFGRGSSRDNPLGGFGTLIAIIVAPFAAMIVQMAISRTREYAADRRGAEICGQPMWLASALRRIAQAAGRIPNDTAEAYPATAHMFIFNPLGQHARDSLFSTHPDVNNRIAALQAIEDEFARNDDAGRRAPAERSVERPVEDAQSQAEPANPDDASPSPWGKADDAGPWDNQPRDEEEAQPKPQSGNSPWGRDGNR